MFQIISDGACDFTAEAAKAANVSIIPFYITFDETNYLKEGIDITRADYFNRLKSDKNLFPKTSQPSPQDYLDVYTPFLEEGKELVVLTLSSKLSGSNNSARIALDMAKETYPDAKIYIVDSLIATISQGLILSEIIKMREAGYTAEKAHATAEKIVKTAKIFFTPETLEYLKRGGRISPAAALIGGTLGIRPVLTVTEGAADQIGKVRGKNKALALIKDTVEAQIKGKTEGLSIKIGHIMSEEDAKAFEGEIEALLGIKMNNPMGEVGATIGTHIGPGAIAVAYCQTYENV